MTPLSFARYVAFHLNGLQGIGSYLENDTFQHIHFGHKGLSLGFANGSISGHRFSATDGSAEFKQPFDLSAETTVIAAQEKMAGMRDFDCFEKWLPSPDSNQGQAD